MAMAQLSYPPYEGKTTHPQKSGDSSHCLSLGGPLGQKVTLWLTTSS